jgi:hypothetical protein
MVPPTEWCPHGRHPSAAEPLNGASLSPRTEGHHLISFFGYHWTDMRLFTQFARSSDDGKAVAFRFCPVCGSTVYWEAERRPDLIAVAVGAFADPGFPAPKHFRLGEETAPLGRDAR